MSRLPDTLGTSERAPEDARPTTRTEEQEVTAGRSSATPFVAIAGVWLVLASAVVVVLGLVVLVLLVV